MATLNEIAGYRPQDIDEALDAMRDALTFFHREHDQRAIFLRAYYLITIAVHQAINQHPPYQARIFFDPQWIRRLAGKFSLLYFQSLSTSERPGERAWKTAHRLAASGTSSVFQDLMLGLNAHINYDLAYGIYLNLEEFQDAREHLLLPRRKFDHDQVNNILVNTMPIVEQTLTRDYGGEIRILGDLSGNLDELLGGVGLKYYRERVWWSAVSYLTTNSEPERDLVRARLDWESAQLAECIAGEGTLLRRTLNRLLNQLSKHRFGPIELEHEAGVAAERPRGQPTPPF